MKKIPAPAKAAALILAIALLASSLPTARALKEPDEPEITAQAAVVMDFDTGELLYARDPDTLRVPASMTKVMTAYIFYQELARGNVTMETPIPISDWVAQISRDKDHYEMVVPLPYGGTVPAGTLLRLMLLYSASASAVAIAEYISGTEEAFVQRMNDTAAQLGLEAQYINSHGHLLNYITARSQASLIRRFIMDYPEVLDITSLASVSFDGKVYPTTNLLLPGQKYAYEGVDGFKTGYIVTSGYCQSVTCLRNGHRLIAVAMNSATPDDRHTDCVKLLDYGYAKISVEELGDMFYDMDEHWALPAVEELYYLGTELHMTGKAYRPDEPVTRAEFTAMLCSTLELRNALPAPVEHDQPEGTITGANWPFSDIADSWAQDYIITAWDRGLVNGSGENTFSPDAPITRQEIMVILDRALEFPDGNGLRFTDVPDIAVWALEAAARLTFAGVFTGGVDGRLNPTGYATRAEAAQLVVRIADMV